MKSVDVSAVGTAFLLLFSRVSAVATHVHHNHAIHHQRLHERSTHDEHYNETHAALHKRTQCAFPTNVGLVPVDPSGQNAGWAMSPDQPCLPGNFCPYACPPGQLSAQWDPAATSYTYPLSMHGGLYCDGSGAISKPFPNKPYCYTGPDTVGVQNLAGAVVSFCQTVLPGNEAMLIPTEVESTATLAIPGTEYWAGTSAEYFINTPGLDAETACVWGTHANPWGNWSPYVGGGNVDKSGTTFMMLGWNPIWLEPATPFRTVMPDFGIRVECVGTGCIGLPCEIDPATMGVNEISQGNPPGAGGANFCIVTIPPGQKANYVVFQKGSKYTNAGVVVASSSAAAAVAPTTSATTAAPVSSVASSSSLSVSSSSATYAPHIFVANTTFSDNTTTTSASKTFVAPTGSTATFATSAAPASTSSSSATGLTVGSAGLLAVLATIFFAAA